MELLIIIGIISSLWFIGWVTNLHYKAKLYDANELQIRNLPKEQKALEEARLAFEEKQKKDTAIIYQLAKEKSEGFPWLAQAYADYFHLSDTELANSLAWKKYPARKSADKVKEIATEKRNLNKQLRVTTYLLKYYENLFPWLVDFRGEDLDELIKSVIEKKVEVVEETKDEDPAKKWLTAAEYKNLPTVEKYQLALNRYWSKKKSPWEIGRDYERYVGYLHEKQGYYVYYQGIIKGLEDIGRDLIAEKGNEIRVIQCKNWSKEKTIHEKHIFQLFGTVTAFRLDNPNKKVVGEFYTSASLSERAGGFAKVLEIEIKEKFPFQQYPAIKCNISKKDGTKIYHLPFDQQYDKTLIEEEKLEMYASTVAEAETSGFRRAFRWRGDKNKNVSSGA